MLRAVKNLPQYQAHQHQHRVTLTRQIVTSYAKMNQMGVLDHAVQRIIVSASVALATFFLVTLARGFARDQTAVWKTVIRMVIAVLKLSKLC